MRQRIILIVSVGLNVALATVLLFPRHHPAPDAVPAPADAAPNASSTGKTRVILRKQFFSWQEVESVDYPTYIANLRDIGCPEQTVRDIIVADVDQLYARKRLTDIPTADQQWWRSEPDANLARAANAKLRSLEQERRGLLTTLLGPGWDLADANAPVRVAIALNGPVLGELSVEVKQAVQAISDRSQQRTAAYVEAQRVAGKPVDAAELARIRQQTRNELAQVLTPAQLEEFVLRYSQSAANLRTAFRGFDITPDEFRKIFRVTDALDLQVQQYAGMDAAASALQRALLDKQREEAIKNALGPARYEQYRLAHDAAYRTAVAAAQQAGASPEAVANLYAVNQATVQELDRIRNDATLTPEQKAEQLKAVQDQQKAASDQLLGVAPPTPTTPPLPAGVVPSQVHTFSPGETITAIAERYGVSVPALRAANPNLDPTQIRNGTPIKIPPTLSPTQ
ncbi:MAG: Peptidoglycan-binding LysM [Pedosphaera sp.]|nr:Peptidoglycan-binding LysM [Pedosphaera sp.]